MVTNDVDEALLLADRIIPLTPAPRATLGKEFRVTQARPRDRHAANHDPEYRRLRADITQYLVDAGRKREQPERRRRAPARRDPDYFERLHAESRAQRESHEGRGERRQVLLRVSNT